ncbi:MAG: putative pre6S rRNA nuclease [Actinomycetota bacterium]|jgi:putative Holliday junction resolvase
MRFGSDMVNGRRLAIDVGTVRVGVAMSDRSGIVASPLTTVSPDDLEEFLLKLRVDEEIAVIYVGLPLHLSGKEGSASAMARATASQLKESLGIPVRLLDERLTTVSAVQKTVERGERPQRSLIDQEAAVALLDFALQAERISGELAGHDVS